MADVQAQFEAMLPDQEHAIYEVRRLTRRSTRRPDGRGITARSVRLTARGTRQQMHSALMQMPGSRQVQSDGIVRHVIRERTAELPALEHFYVVCPAVVEDKERAGFDAWWQEATTDDVLF
ncbi:hypothetical protein VXE65_32615 [Mycolicibacterium conceptionense]|uniref:hypothetical protein n=1 Tax=Mycolicibacterium conceptionense TaxID=451644 RepID=UPI003204DF5A